MNGRPRVQRVEFVSSGTTRQLTITLGDYGLQVDDQSDVPADFREALRQWLEVGR